MKESNFSIDRLAIASLIVSRIFYGVNFSNIASVFSLISIDFKQDVSGLGLINLVSLVCIGIFQVPGGLLATRIGPKKVTISGTAIASSAALLTGLATEFQSILVLRSFVALGMAFVYAPGVALVARSFGKRSEGFGIGLFNSAASVGGAAGLFGWALLGEAIGWRLSLVTSGVLGLVGTVLLEFSLPKDPVQKDFHVRRSDLRVVLLDRRLIFLSLGLLGVNVGFNLISNFVVFYLEESVQASSGIAGLTGALGFMSVVIASPIFGKVYDKLTHAERLLFFSGVLMSVGLSIAAIPTIYAALIATTVVGLATGMAFTLGFSMVMESNRLKAKYEVLSVSWANSISLFGGFWSPLAFSLSVVEVGYPFAWLLSSVYTLLLILPLLFVKKIRIGVRTPPVHG